MNLLDGLRWRRRNADDYGIFHSIYAPLRCTAQPAAPPFTVACMPNIKAHLVPRHAAQYFHLFTICAVALWLIAIVSARSRTCRSRLMRSRRSYAVLERNVHRLGRSIGRFSHFLSSALHFLSLHTIDTVIRIIGTR